MFATSMNKARTRSRVGPPKDKALEYFRHATINELIIPSVVIPGVTGKLNKTKAVEYVEELEARLVDGEGGTRSIWTAYKRADQFFQNVIKRMQDEFILSPPLTDRLDSEVQIALWPASMDQHRTSTGGR